MTKTKLFSNINGKKCNVAINGISRYRYLYNLMRDVQKVREQGHTVLCTLTDAGFVELSNGQFFMPPNLPRTDQKIIVKSSFLYVGETRVDKKNVIVIDDNTFKTKTFTCSMV
jgi:hypothetical protein